MACYLGCASRSNKIRWACAVLLALLALAFIVACAVTSYPCQDNAEQLRDEGGVTSASALHSRILIRGCFDVLGVLSVAAGKIAQGL